MSITNLGGTFAVSTTTVNADQTLSEFEGLTYTEVGKVGNIGDTGISQNAVSFSTWDQPVLQKGKGEADAGNPELEFLDEPSAGMDLMLAAAAFDDADNRAFRIQWPDGSKEYNRGLVMGPTRPKGGNEDFKRVVFTLGLQQPPEIVDAS